MLWPNVFFPLKHIFVMKKYTSSEMLSFLHRVNLLIKCECDTDVKIQWKIISP